MNENLKAFLQKVSEDDNLKAKLTEINDSMMNDVKAKFIKLAEENGYSFTEEDLERITAKNEKLSEDELNAVAGGSYTLKTKEGKLYSSCMCALAGVGEGDALQKKCVCELGGCGELTALGKQKAENGEIVWDGNKGAKVAMWCVFAGASSGRDRGSGPAPL